MRNCLALRASLVAAALIFPAITWPETAWSQQEAADAGKTQTDAPAGVDAASPETATRPPSPEVPAAAADLRPMTPLPEQLQQLMAGGTPLNSHQTVALDRKKGRLLLHTQVACDDCILEMLCCLEQTKEHESILWLRSKAYVVHVGLLALGAEPGRPVTFTPEFMPPSGPKIDIFVNWVDQKGQLQRCDARQWVRHAVSRYYSHKLPAPPPGVELPLMELRYDPFNKEILWYGHMTEEQRDKLLSLWDDEQFQKAVRTFYRDSQTRPMTADFVFTGSYQFQQEDTGQKVYAAEGGEVICVANFASSLIDVREASSASDGGQSYEARPDTVPERGTPVVVELIPAAQRPVKKRSINNQ
ncbi:MAG: YdjY domain-containing protein [Fuerstiella sp.]